MKFTITVFAALVGFSSAVPFAESEPQATTPTGDKSSEVLCYSPQKNHKFCGEFDTFMDSSKLDAKKTEPATVSYSVDGEGNPVDVKLCFKKQKCYHATQAADSRLLEISVKGPGKNEIVLLIDDHVYKIDTKKDTIPVAKSDKRGLLSKSAGTDSSNNSSRQNRTSSWSNSTVAIANNFRNNSAPAHVNISYTTSYVTKTVPSYVTYCPTPTVFTQGKKVYVVTAPSLVTVTNCPCTITSASVAPFVRVKATSAPYPVSNGTAAAVTGAFTGLSTGGNGAAFPTGAATSGAVGAISVTPFANGTAAAAGNNGAASPTGAVNSNAAAANGAAPTVAPGSNSGSNVGAVGANPGANSGSNTAPNNAGATNSNVGAFQGAANTFAPGVVALLTVAVAACFL